MLSDSSELPEVVDDKALTTPKPQPVPSPAPAHQPRAPIPAPPPTQKSSGWGSWGGSLIETIGTDVSDMQPSPKGPPSGFTPNQPPKNQPAGFGPSKKPGWGDTWGGPTPIAQKTPSGPAWGVKPVGGFGPGLSHSQITAKESKPPSPAEEKAPE